jgi:hypothetical protein
MVQAKIKLRLILISAIVAVLAAQPATAASWSQYYKGNTGTNLLGSAVLTPDGADIYGITKSGGAVTITAPATNTGSNLRKVFWPAGTPSYTNTQSCATWTSQSAESAQEGLAFRITNTGGTTRAVTVTKNVIYGIHWVFNVHTWDSASSQPFTQIAQFDMVDLMIQNGAMRPFPWRTCARVVGNTLTFKIWFPSQQAEPSWTDPVHTRSTNAIPAGYLSAGKSGWYIGHIPPAGSVKYNDLGLWRYQ